jgi:hypothetical protein
MSDIYPLIGSIVGGLAGLAALIKVFIDARNARPNIAEAYERMATNQAKQIEDLRGRVNKLESDLNDANVYIDELLIGIDKLISKMCEAGMQIPYKPRKRDKKYLPTATN